MNRAYKTLCPVPTGAPKWAVIMSKGRLRNVEFDNEQKCCTSSVLIAKRYLFLDAPHKIGLNRNHGTACAKNICESVQVKKNVL